MQEILTREYPVPPNPAWEIIDTSKCKDYLDCPRKFFYRHVLGWESTAPNNHLVFGEAFHRALAHLLQTDFSETNLLIAYNERFMPHYRENFPSSTDEMMGPKAPDSALIALAEYAQRYADDLSKYEVLFVEVAGAAPIAKDRVIHLRIDAIMRHKLENYIFCQEHKTGSGVTRWWTDQWDLDLQPGTYTHACRCAFPGDVVKGTQINGVHFKRLKTKGPQIDFARLPIWKNDNAVAVWLWTINSIVDDIMIDFEWLSRHNGSEPVMQCFRMNPNSCTKYFGCDYHSFCGAWANPLQKVDSPQHGFHISFWDPREQEAQYQLNADGTVEGK